MDEHPFFRTLIGQSSLAEHMADTHPRNASYWRRDAEALRFAASLYLIEVAGMDRDRAREAVKAAHDAQVSRWVTA